MENQEIPQAWIGQEVIVRTIDNKEFLINLVEVKDIGFAYQFENSESPIFAPWSVIRWMRLPGSDDENMRRGELGWGRSDVGL